MTVLFLVLVLVPLTVLVLIGSVFVFRRMMRKEQETLWQVDANDQRLNQLGCLARSCSDESLKAALDALAERVRFSDWAIATPVDPSIDHQIHQMLGDGGGAAPPVGDEEVATLNALLDQRADYVRAERRGGF